MKKFLQSAILAALLIALSTANAAAPGAYAGQESRAIKALSAEEVSSLLAGKGMGLAKAAELNGFPGPAHVLELSQELGLTEDQRVRTRALLEQMDATAKQKGAALVAAERDLDNLFKAKQLSPETLTTQLPKIASLQAQIRGVHLAAHLEQVKVLSPTQITQYNMLRGYTSEQPQAHQHDVKNR